MDESLGDLLAQVRARIVAAIAAKIAPMGITWAQWGTLLQIANGKADTAAPPWRASTRPTAWPCCATGRACRLT